MGGEVTGANPIRENNSYPSRLSSGLSSSSRVSRDPHQALKINQCREQIYFETEAYRCAALAFYTPPVLLISSSFTLFYLLFQKIYLVKMLEIKIENLTMNGLLVKAVDPTQTKVFHFQWLARWRCTIQVQLQHLQ